MTKLDFFDPALLADPSRVCHILLAGEPVTYYEDFRPPFYIVSRYDDIETVLRNPGTFVSGQGQGPNYMEPAGVVSDPPDHTWFRKLVQEDFQPAAIARLEPRLQAIAEECLDTVEDSSDWDLHDTLAFPLPIRIICEILGIPSDDIWQFKAWSDASVAALAAEDPEQFREGAAPLSAYILGLIAEKRSRPDSSLISRIANTQRDGAYIPEGEAISLTSQMFVAGNETTTSLITNFVWRLSQLDLWQSFTSGDIDIDLAINESLRFDPPLLALFRTAAADTEIGGTTIPAGSKVMMYYAAANRDPAAFDVPDTFIPHRRGRRVMSFGIGIHFCLGSDLARLEARIALEALRRRFPDLQVLGSGERIAPFLFWGRSKLPVGER